MSVEAAQRRIYDAIDRLILEAKREVIHDLLTQWPWVIDYIPTEDEMLVELGLKEHVLA